jgi:PKD repeat protein
MDGNDWRTRGMFATAAPVPVASFNAPCTGLSFSYDASASTATSSTITSYAWSFGDGNTATGVTASNTYAAGGTDTVTLTVTNALGSTAVSSQTVSPIAAAAPIAFVAATSTNGNATTETVTIPAGVAQGNGMLLFATGATTGPLAAPAGWTLVRSSPASTAITTSVWQRVATATDAGTTVSVGFNAIVHGTVQLVAYSGTNATSPVLSSAVVAGNGTVSVTTPTLTDTTSGSWVVSYWTAKSSTVNTWTTPATQTTRNLDNGSGSGRINSAIADSGGSVAQGTVGGLTASTDQTPGAVGGWTIILQP